MKKIKKTQGRKRNESMMAGFIFPISAIALYAFDAFNIEFKQLLAIVLVYMITLIVVFMRDINAENKQLNEENNHIQIDQPTNSIASPNKDKSMIVEISVVLIIKFFFLSVFGLSYFNGEINISFLSYVVISLSISFIVIIAIFHKILTDRKNNQSNTEEVTNNQRIPNIGNPLANDFNKKLKNHKINLNKDI
jgi:hypothetical protein